MKRLLRTWNEGRAEHREMVRHRVRGLASVAHEFHDINPVALRSKLNGGRSALAGVGRVAADG